MNEGKEPYDADVACGVLRDMWLSIAESWQHNAENAGTPQDAVLWASAASHAYWAATGEALGLSLEQIVKHPLKDGSNRIGE